MTLLGQNVNSYGTRLRPQRSFAELLRELDAIDGLDRIRYTSPHPSHMGEDVVRAHADLPSVCEHIHLPLQAGSSRVLKACAARTTAGASWIASRCMREHVPDVRDHDGHHRRLPG